MVAVMVLEALQSIAAMFLAQSNSDLDMALSAGELEEIYNGEGG